jgi:hypothetical protein
MLTVTTTTITPITSITMMMMMITWRNRHPSSLDHEGELSSKVVIHCCLRTVLALRLSSLERNLYISLMSASVKSTPALDFSRYLACNISNMLRQLLKFVTFIW